MTTGTTPEASEMVGLLRYAQYIRVAEALGVSRNIVSKWAKGRSVTPYRVRQVRELLTFGPQTKESPPPHWATGLVNDVPAIRGDVEQVVNELAILRALLEARQSGLLPPYDDPVDNPPLQPIESRRDQ